MRSSASGEAGPLASLGAATGGVVGLGSHGGGSSAELHNTLIVRGPSFKSDYRSKIPSGNVDIAPTILHLFGIPVPGHFDGRVLTEALQHTGIENVNNSHALMDESSKSKTVAITKAQYLHTEYMCQFG